VDFRLEGHFIGVFLQDNWKLNDRLTINLGGRYDIEVIPVPNEENPLFDGVEARYPVDGSNFSPRVGFSYAADDRSVIRGGAGVFYQRTSYTFLNPLFTNQVFSNSFTASFPTQTFDPGPRQGRFPTHPLLVNGPVVNHSAIDALFPPGSVARNTGTVRFDSPDREVPWARQYSLGYERQLGQTIALSLDFIRSEQRKQYMMFDLNPPLRSTGLATGSLTRTNTDPSVGEVGDYVARVETFRNVGWIDYNSLQVSLEKRMSRGARLRASYAYSRGRGNTDSGQGDSIVSQVLSDMRLDSEIGPTSIDRPHVVSVNGSYEVPRTGGLLVSGVVQARSGLPFSIIDSTFDADRNGFTGNEYLPPGTYSGTGEDAITVENEGGRRGARGPGYVNLDLRAGYRFRLGAARTLEASFDVINATNRANFNAPTGDRRAANFLRVTSIVGGGPTRTMQFNLRYAF
jgi:hypothetical protein